eukprot:1465105-Rhodomonas_salina.6
MASTFQRRHDRHHAWHSGMGCRPHHCEQRKCETGHRRADLSVPCVVGSSRAHRGACMSARRIQ